MFKPFFLRFVLRSLPACADVLETFSGDYAAGFQNGFIQIQGRLGILLTIYDHLELIGYKLRLMCWLLGAA